MPNLNGLRVLIVEDEVLVSMLLEDIISDLGGTVTAAPTTLKEALEAARREAVDVAIMDVNLRGEMSYPAAEVLALRGVAVVLVTGYARDALPPSLRHVPVLAKPYSAQDIARAVNAVTGLAPEQRGGYA